MARTIGLLHGSDQRDETELPEILIRFILEKAMLFVD